MTTALRFTPTTAHMPRPDEGAVAMTEASLMDHHYVTPERVTLCGWDYPRRRPRSWFRMTPGLGRVRCPKCRAAHGDRPLDEFGDEVTA